MTVLKYYVVIAMNYFLSPSSYIPQVDGNVSWLEDEDEMELSRIPVICGFRPQKSKENNQPRDHCRKTIKRNDKIAEAYNLPKFTLYNMRSLAKKFFSLISDMEERTTSLSVLTETWEFEDNIEEKLEEARQEHDITYVSLPRKQGKRKGGGCGFLLRGSDYSISILNVPSPKYLETCWALLRPIQPGAINKIILGAFYCPPDFSVAKRKELVNFLTVTVNTLKVEHKSARLLLAGDRNRLPIEDLLKVTGNSGKTNL